MSFAYDIFISYARVNDSDTGWVSKFKQRLEGKLQEQIPGGIANVCLDLGEIGIGPLRPTLREKVSSSALFLVVLSNRWLERSWCLEELAAFVDVAGGVAQAQKRIALVRVENVKQDRLPDILRNCRVYDFFTIHPTKKVTLTYGLAEFPNLDADYLLTLFELVGGEDRPGLVTSLIELKGSKPVVSTDGPTIFLADGTPDLNRDRADLKRHLEEQGFRIVPTTPFYHAPPNFEDDIITLLGNSLLFIQVCGPFRYEVTRAFPKGYEVWQLQQARSIKGDDILRWRRPDLRPENIDPDNREFIFADDVTRCDLAEFKVTLENKLREIASRRNHTAEQVRGRIVLVNAALQDDRMGQEVGIKVENLCMEMGLTPVYADVLSEGSSLFDVASHNPFDGLVVVYGECAHRWVCAQMDQWRRVALRLKQKVPICALYLGPPDAKPALEPRPARFGVIDYRDENRLRAFVRQVAEKAELR